MIKVLVVSDNANLVDYLKSEIVGDDIKALAEFKFCYSIVNKDPGDLVKIGMSSIDLRSLDVCDEIKAKYDVVMSLHCKQIFPKELVNGVRCINFHPGLNPYNRGWYPQVFAIVNKEPIGATIHIMDEMVDHGKIIDQEEVEVFPTDTSLSLYNRVIDLEKKLISKNLRKILTGKYNASEPGLEGNYNSIQDFKRLCELDLNKVGTLRDHIDQLRALTHGDFKNAFYYHDGQKIYVSINLFSHSE